MLSAMLLLVGAVLVGMALVEKPVQRLPLSSALVYLAAGWGAAWLAPDWVRLDLFANSNIWALVSEWAVLISLFSIGLKLGRPSALAGWRVAALLASSGMVATVVLGTLGAHLLLGLAWPAALLLAAILAPTDPVLASDVQVHSESDRDEVRLALTAEGALNDGTSFPAVMLGLAALGEHTLGEYGQRWLLQDLIWPMAGGIALGWLLGRGLGRLVRLRRRSQPMNWDELLFLGTIALTCAVAGALRVSTFLAVFFAGVALLNAGHRPLPGPAEAAHDEPLADNTDLPHRMMAFGERCERLVEVLLVLAIGVALTTVDIDLNTLLFALVLLFIVRPLSAWLGVWPKRLPQHQRRLIAWFGVRGVGSLFYLSYVMSHGVDGVLAHELASACLLTIALSIVLHGVSATPLMRRYRRV
jgi:NhaP-type Na+/H+ or K+/H+ antiporter